MSDNHTKHVDPCVMTVQGRATYSVSRETKLKGAGRIVLKCAESQDKRACWQVWMKVHIFRFEICVAPFEPILHRHIWEATTVTGITAECLLDREAL